MTAGFVEKKTKHFIMFLPSSHTHSHFKAACIVKTGGLNTEAMSYPYVPTVQKDKVVGRTVTLPGNIFQLASSVSEFRGV